MRFIVPEEVTKIYNVFKQAGYEIFLVGGCVRNLLLELPVKDWDMTTNATPEQMMQLFPDAFYDNVFGTVGIPVILSETKNLPENSEKALHSVQDDNNQIIEVTTYRTEREYEDGRHPTSVSWGKTIEGDLERRDFTMNAMAYDIATNTFIDPFDGSEDIQHKQIRAVGDPSKRFKEDALRLMRAIRFASQLNFQIEDATWKSIKEDSMLLPAISGERIRDELLKILATERAYEGIIMLLDANLLQYILPELLEGIRLSQVRPGRHHIFDVFEHNTLSLKLCPSHDPIVRFATLIHDVGKSRVVGKDENGLVIFYNHEIAGSQLAYEICNRLHFSKKDRSKICKLIRWHMFSVDEHITDSAVRRFIRRIGVENVRDMIDLRIGDRLGSGIDAEKAESWRLKKFKERIEEQLKPAPFSINDLVIDGKDIMQELQIQPGPIIGKLLQSLFEEVDENLDLNTKEHLLKRVKELYTPKQ